MTITEIPVLKAKCPVCNHLFKQWYCPTCGLPISTTDRRRPEYNHFKNYQLCSECNTPNPYEARFCRSCGKSMSSQAKDRKGHGWVDLGLSVLWSNEIMAKTYQWMSSADIFIDDDPLMYTGNGKDAASEVWGHKWRTPTKDEFEELFTKCRWERCIDPISKQYALKATGPNGNSITLTLKSSKVLTLWTSTEYTAKYDGKCAYAFVFHNDIEIEKTLTDKQKKEIEFQKSNKVRFSLQCLSLKRFLELRNEEDEEDEKRRRYPEYEKTLEQQRQILDAMGDDSLERRDNEKKDKEELDKLWLSTPVNLSFNKEPISRTMRIFGRKSSALSILPVADIKWKGNL